MASNQQNKKLKKSFGDWIISILSIFAVSSFPALFMYFQNADEVKFLDVIAPLFMFIITASLIFVAFFFKTRCVSKSAIITSLFMMLLQNYSIIEKLIQKVLPSLRYWQVLPICLFILLNAAWLILKKIPEDISKTTTFIMCIVFCGLILFNGVVATPILVKKVLYNQKHESNDLIQQMGEDENLPNVYYLIFDEYASFKQIKNSYEFDNSSTAERLEKLGFSVSYNSYNESLYTSTVMTNILNLDYLVDNKMDALELEYKRHNNELFKLIKQKGYKLVGIGAAEFYGLEGTTSGQGAKAIGGESFSDILFQKTVIYPLIKIDTTAYMDKILNSVSYMTDGEKFPSSGQFTLFHIACPHTPFVFDENGRQISYDNYMNWKDKKYYLGQYKYATKLMMKIVESIIERDPNSIIILQSDHGARQGVAGKTNSSDDMHCILNAVYYKGEPIDIEGLSGVNTMRVLANRLFNTNYELLELPEDNYDY